jgi:hypothetical protein
MKIFIAGMLGAIALSCVAVPAFAAEYVVAQEKGTMKCSVIETTTTTTMTVLTKVGSYKTPEEAHTAMIKETSCKS